jgi:hypothetical protein
MPFLVFSPLLSSLLPFLLAFILWAITPLSFSFVIFSFLSPISPYPWGLISALLSLVCSFLFSFFLWFFRNPSIVFLLVGGKMLKDYGLFVKGYFAGGREIICGAIIVYGR